MKLTNRDKLNPHGAKIVEIFKNKNDLEDFIKMWRQHFIDNNDTKYLPKGWRIDHKFARNFGALSKFGKGKFEYAIIGNLDNSAENKTE